MQFSEQILKANKSETKTLRQDTQTQHLFQITSCTLQQKSPTCTQCCFAPLGPSKPAQPITYKLCRHKKKTNTKVKVKKFHRQMLNHIAQVTRVKW